MNSHRSSAPISLQYLRKYYVIHKERMKSKVTCYIQAGTRKSTDSTVYTYDGDSILIKDDYRLVYSKKIRHDLSQKTYFNSFGQPQRCVSLSPERGTKSERLYEYTQEGQLNRSKQIVYKEGESAIIKDSTQYNYDDKGIPQKVEYFVLKRDSLVLHREFTFKFFSSH